MSKSNATEPEKEIGNQVRLRNTKKESRQNGAEPEQFTDVLRKYRCHYQVFQLNITGTPEGFTSLMTVFSSNQDGEVWMNLELYGNRGHMDEAISMFMKDENTLSLMNSNLNSLALYLVPLGRSSDILACRLHIS